jgi:hypothetical protein
MLSNGAFATSRRACDSNLKEENKGKREREEDK